jgi:hypothetical protein
MLLDLSRALSFLLSILSLYWAMISAFFVPGSSFEERLNLALFRLGLAAATCFFSGLLFSWPSSARRRRYLPLTSTLPVQLFFWTVAAIAVLFLGSWYLATYPCTSFLSRECNL